MSTIRRLSTAESAKLLRAELKRVFPKTTFSVRSKTYSGGSSIDVSWTDGPTARQVKAVADRYQGADFDGMEDLKTYRGPVTVDGERVEMGADYVFCHRDFSPAFVRHVAAIVGAKYGINVPVVEQPGGAVHWGDDYQMVVGNSTARDLCWQEAQELFWYGLGYQAETPRPEPAGPAAADAAAPGFALSVETDGTFLSFGRKPRAAVRQALRERGFRWDAERVAWKAPGPVITTEDFVALGLAPAAEVEPVTAGGFTPPSGPAVPAPAYFGNSTLGLDEGRDVDPDGERDDEPAVWDDDGTPEQRAQRDAENAADMLDFLQTTGLPPAEEFTEAEVARLDPVIVRLRRAADSAARQAEGKRSSGIYNQNPTPRRMRQLEGIEADARRLEQTAAALRALADQREAGALPPLLAPLTTRAMVERLILTDSFPSQEWDRPLWTAFIRAGITKERYLAVRAALLPLAEGSTAEAPAERQIRDALRALVGVRIPDYFPTPPAVIDRLLAEADIRDGMTVLEPSAGAGHIADAIRVRYPGAQLILFEAVRQLCFILGLKGYNTLFYRDFLDAQPGAISGYQLADRIVANPPFSDLQDIDHVRHMYTWLRPGGRLVSVMGESAFFRSDRKAREFRDWLDAVGGWSERLPAGSFEKSERPTGVATRIVVVDKE